jgi:thiamine-monophosphate kinase
MNERRSRRRETNEAELVAFIGRALSPGFPSRTLALGIGDDAALLPQTSGQETVLSCDWFLEGTHFLPNRHPPDSVGWKCLARAVSDLVAMGARPRCFLLSLALPARLSGKWLERFLGGLKAASENLNCPAAGGDTTRRDEVLINVTAVGECPMGSAILRSGAKPGDSIFVSGRLGQAAYGLRVVETSKRAINPRDPRLHRHLYPELRLKLGSWLARERLATAMMDLSDGLSSDLGKLCQASRVGARIETERIPTPRFSPLPGRDYDELSLALDGGDDYELLFTVSPDRCHEIPRRLFNTAITFLGHIRRGKGVFIVNGEGRALPLAGSGWDPFRR